MSEKQAETDDPVDAVIMELQRTGPVDLWDTHRFLWLAAIERVRSNPSSAVSISEAIDGVLRRRFAGDRFVVEDDDDLWLLREELIDCLSRTDGIAATEVLIRLGANAPEAAASSRPHIRYVSASAVAARPDEEVLPLLLEPPPDIDPVFLLLVVHELVMRGRDIPDVCELLRERATVHPVAALPIRAVGLEAEALRVAMRQRVGFHQTELASVSALLSARLGLPLTLEPARLDLIESLVLGDADLTFNGRFAVFAHQLRVSYRSVGHSQIGGWCRSTVSGAGASSFAAHGFETPLPLLADNTRARAISPELAFAMLCSIGHSPGAYSEGSWSRGRLAAWRALAGFADLPWPASLIEIEDWCRSAQWLLVEPDDPWFVGLGSRRLQAWGCWVVARVGAEVVSFAYTSID